MSIFKKIFKKVFGSPEKNENFPTAPKIVSEQEIRLVVRKLFNEELFPSLFYFNSSVTYWENVILAICFAESGFNKYERFFEKTMGYYSEGLMQLSYEDCKRYDFDFDMQNEGIFEVFGNIFLGMTIINRLVERHGNYIFNNGNYWAVLQPKNKRHQIFLNKFNEYQGGNS